MTPLLSVHQVVKRYARRTGWPRRARGWVHAVDDVTLEIWAGETVGLVGESGCGKSTLARLLVGLARPTAGEVRFRNQPLIAMSRTEARGFHRSVQMIFQSPLMSLNPRMRIKDIVAEPLRIHRLADGQRLRARVAGLLEEVGLEAVLSNRYPHELSGGQRQRVAIARALAVRPALIVCDEPVASLDLSVQMQILRLLLRLQDAHHMTYVFISHHLGVVGAIAHRVLVMYLGRIVEVGENPAIFQHPLHPYTQALIASVLQPASQQLSAPAAILGEPTSPLHIPSGCRFHPRCPKVESRCRLEDPALIPRTGGRLAACHFA